MFFSCPVLLNVYICWPLLQIFIHLKKWDHNEKYTDGWFQLEIHETIYLSSPASLASTSHILSLL